MHAGLPRSPLLSFNSFALSFPSTRSFVSFSSLRPTLLTILKTFAHKQHVVTTIYVLLELPGHCYFPCFPKPSSFPACTNFQEKKRTRDGNETEDKLRVLIPKKSILPKKERGYSLSVLKIRDIVNSYSTIIVVYRLLFRFRSKEITHESRLLPRSNSHWRPTATRKIYPRIRILLRTIITNHPSIIVNFA